MKSGPFLGLLCLLIASAAMAYILPGTSVLRRMVETRNSIEFSNGRIEGGLSFFGETAKLEPRVFVGASGGHAQNPRHLLADDHGHGHEGPNIFQTGHLSDRR